MLDKYLPRIRHFIRNGKHVAATRDSQEERIGLQFNLVLLSRKNPRQKNDCHANSATFFRVMLTHDPKEIDVELMVCLR